MIIDVDDILNASVQESQAESQAEAPAGIDRMFQEAEFKRMEAEDELNRAKIEAKNGLEIYCFTARSTLVVFGKKDRDKIEKAVWATLGWLRNNHFAEKDEYEAKQKELQGMVKPIINVDTDSDTSKGY